MSKHLHTVNIGSKVSISLHQLKQDEYKIVTRVLDSTKVANISGSYNFATSEFILNASQLNKQVFEATTPDHWQ
jgi:predicted thioesterase